MNDNDIVIVAAKRTPAGALMGNFATLTAPELGAIAHRAALEQAGLDPKKIDEVISGCVLQAGIGQAPGRQASLAAGIPNSVPVTTINKMCGSGMKAVMLANDLIKAGSAEVVLAGGMESMTNAPYLLPKARAGFRLGHGEVKDAMFLDGLEDAYDRGKLMGYFADETAKRYHFDRKSQDDYAARSMQRALKAQKEECYQQEVAPVLITDKKGQTQEIRIDEGPDENKLAKIPYLKPAFQKDGTVTAANSSSISDGAASLIVMSYGTAKKLGIKPLARIVAHASQAQEPEWFTTAPIEAIRKVMKMAGWNKEEVDLYEINEAFAVVTMAAIKELELDEDRVNVHGGACALGHPIGASGARILVTLLYALMGLHKKRGIASLCIGGGEAVAMAIELV